nr:hypothetical protein [Desulfotalea psychrophila]
MRWGEVGSRPAMAGRPEFVPYSGMIRTAPLSADAAKREYALRDLET